MKKNVYICVTESVAVQQKLTEHCKSTILQLKKKPQGLRFLWCLGEWGRTAAELFGIASSNNTERGPSGRQESPGRPGLQRREQCKQLDRPVTGEGQGPRESRVS